jgi:hypothetical protein
MACQGRTGGHPDRTMRLEMNTTLRDAIFSLGPHIRYVAFGDGQRVETAQRDAIADASGAGSDFFEELLVNPMLLTLARQRGDLDCCGLRPRHRRLWETSPRCRSHALGHVLGCVERDAGADGVARQVAELLEQS